MIWTKEIVNYKLIKCQIYNVDLPISPFGIPQQNHLFQSQSQNKNRPNDLMSKIYLNIMSTCFLKYMETTIPREKQKEIDE